MRCLDHLKFPWVLESRRNLLTFQFSSWSPPFAIYSAVLTKFQKIALKPYTFVVNRCFSLSMSVVTIQEVSSSIGNSQSIRFDCIAFTLAPVVFNLSPKVTFRAHLTFYDYFLKGYSVVLTVSLESFQRLMQGCRSKYLIQPNQESRWTNRSNLVVS